MVSLVLIRMDLGTLTFSLILFLQNLHLTVCLMIASFDTHVYTEARVYSAIPIPKKLMTTSMKELSSVINKIQQRVSLGITRMP